MRLRFWALVICLIGLAVGLAAALAQTLQATRMLEGWSRENIAWYTGQLEVELWRLIEAADRYVDDDPAFDKAALGQRINVLWGRIAVFDGGSPHARMAQVEGALQAVDQLRRALTEVEPRLSVLAPGDHAAYAPIRAALAGAAPSVKEIANHVELFEARRTLEDLRALQGEFAALAGLIVAGFLVGILLIGLLLLEIGNRRRMLAAMRSSQEEARLAGQRFRAIAEAHPVAVVVIDTPQAIIRYANPAAAALLEMPSDQAGHRSLYEFFLDPDELRTVVETAGRTRVDRYETGFRRGSGDGFPAELSVRSLDYDGAPSLLVRILDLSEKQAAQAEIERQREIIHQREKLAALGSLLAGVAHELNNPLSVVIAQATLLREVAADSDIARRGERIQAAAERCGRIIKTFLAMARQRPPTRTVVNVNDAIESALELLGYGLRTAGIELRRELDPDLPTICADGDQIGQVLANLIINAQHAMTDWPGLRCLTIATAVDRDGGAVQVSVADTGPGVPPRIRSRIFDPFFTTKPLGAGTGVGLSVCHGVVTAHGGTITVGDGPGGGARFVVHLPIGSGTDPALEEATAPALAAPGRRLLIVEDEADVAQSLAEILAPDGYHIDLADSGAAALARIRAVDYDAILSDVRMADIGGLELHRRVKALDPALASRFIVMTGDTLSGAVRMFLDETGLACIDKPFAAAEVRRLVAVVASGAPTP